MTSKVVLVWMTVKFQSLLKCIFILVNHFVRQLITDLFPLHLILRFTSRSNHSLTEVPCVTLAEDLL